MGKSLALAAKSSTRSVALMMTSLRAGGPRCPAPPSACAGGPPSRAGLHQHTQLSLPCEDCWSHGNQVQTRGTKLNNLEMKD